MRFDEDISLERPVALKFLGRTSLSEGRTRARFLLLGVALQVAEGIAAARGRAIAHRDLKPG